jgi:hypothetical protein
MKLAKIYYKEELIQHKKIKYVEYIKVNNISEINFDDNKYLIYIFGWHLIKDIEKINILNKRISRNIFWEFSFSEKKKDYFMFFINLNENIFYFHYKKFNKINIKLSELIDIVNNKSILFITFNKVLYYINKNIIYIINLKEEYFFDYQGTNQSINILKKSVNKIFYDKNSKFLNRVIKYFVDVDLELIKILLPYFYYIFSFKK